MKDTYYFPHDSNARNDERLLAVRLRHGMEGYGVYFAIIEKLRENANYACLKDYNLIAFELRVSAGVVKSVVEEFGLFTFTEDGKRFYSESLVRRMEQWYEKREALSASRRHAALSRWESSKNKESDANAMQEPCKVDANAKQSAAKEKKEEKKKEEREKEAPGGAALQKLELKEEKQREVGKKQREVREQEGRGREVPVAAREKAFYEAIAAYKDEYPSDLLRAFYDYWRQPSSVGERMQFEQVRPCFDVGFRLSRWAAHEREFKGKAGVQAGKLYTYEEVTVLVTSGKAGSTSDFERVCIDGKMSWRLKSK